MHEYTADHSGSLAVEQEEFISYCGLYDYVIQQTPSSNWLFSSFTKNHSNYAQ